MSETINQQPPPVGFNMVTVAAAQVRASARWIIEENHGNTEDQRMHEHKFKEA
jgi:hypothetical protein